MSDQNEAARLWRKAARYSQYSMYLWAISAALWIVYLILKLT